MKLLAKTIEKNGEGVVKMQPQDEEDMWHVYNLVVVGDHVTTTSFRKVQSTSNTGSSSSTKVKLELTVEVETIDYDPQKGGLRLKGKVANENPHVKLGAYHTVELEAPKVFTIFKNSWDSIALDRITAACDSSQTAEVAALVMQSGLANLCLITNHTTLVKAKIEVSIPRKRTGSSDRHDKGSTRFFNACLDAILRNINFKIIKCFIVAGPAFIKNDFWDFVCAEAIKKDHKVILENKNKFLLIQASSGYKHALKEVLEDPAVAQRVSNTKAFSEVAKLEEFMGLLEDEPARAFYGFDHVRRANEARAIQTLLVTDSLFRAATPAVRKQYIALVEDCKDNGGEVLVFSASHVSGEQLAQLSGVAALLRFPMPDMDIYEDEYDSEEDQPKASSY